MGDIAIALVLQQDEPTAFVADDDIHFLIAIQISRDDLSADAGVVVDQMSNVAHPGLAF
jgi:hypothetical protein